jgi:hypothetical protein
VTDKKYRNVDIKRASKAGREVSKFYQDAADGTRRIVTRQSPLAQVGSWLSRLPVPATSILSNISWLLWRRLRTCATAI